MPRQTLDDLVFSPAGLDAVGAAPTDTIRGVDASADVVLPALTLDDGGGNPSPSATGSGIHLVVLSTIGEGGVGRVRLARQPLLERDVAVKSLKPGLARNARHGLIREARVMGSLEHPNIVPVHALGADATGDPVLVMKRIEGESWRRLIAEPTHPLWERWHGRQDRTARQVEVLLEVCNAVAFAHARGVAHRDLKPENVMVGPFGEVYVLDWGIACRLDGSEPRQGVVGSPAYMAPEMVEPGAPVVEATDVYLLGSCLHVALTDTPRHAGADVATALAAAARSEPVAYGPEVHVELASIANRATSRVPSDRYPTVAALREALRAWLEHRGSADLAAAAMRRMAELRTQLDAGSARDEARIAATFSEVRFGFRQALAQWPDNAPAQVALVEVLGWMVDDGLAREEVHTTGACLAELRELDCARPDAERSLDTLRNAMAQRKQLAVDMDLTAHNQPRIVYYLGVCVAGVAVTVAGVSTELDAERLFWLMFAFLGVVVLGMAVMRRRLLALGIDRRLMATLLITLSLLLVNRGLGWADGTSVALIMRNDLMIVAGAAGAGVLIHRLAWGLSAVCAAAAAAIVVWPHHGVTIFVAVVTALPLMMVVFWMSLRWWLDR